MNCYILMREATAPASYGWFYNCTQGWLTQGSLRRFSAGLFFWQDNTFIFPLMWPMTIQKKQDIISQENVFNELFVAACTSDYMKIHWLQVWQHIHTYKQVVHFCIVCIGMYNRNTLHSGFKVVQVCYIYWQFIKFNTPNNKNNKKEKVCPLIYTFTRAPPQ